MRNTSALSPCKKKCRR